MIGFGQYAITQHAAREYSKDCCGKGVVSYYKTVNGKTITTPLVRTMCSTYNGKVVSVSSCKC